MTFDDLSATADPLDLDTTITAEGLWARMDDLNQSAELYSRARGVHTSALTDGEQPAEPAIGGAVAGEGE